MKTAYQKNASNSSKTSRLSAIAAGARGLWAAELPKDAPDRVALTVELLDLELAVERLTLRASGWRDRPEDDERIQACAEQLVSLERRWHEAAAAAVGAKRGGLLCKEKTADYKGETRS